MAEESLMTGNTPSTGEAAPADTTPAPATDVTSAASEQTSTEGQTSAPEGADAGTEGDTPVQQTTLGAPEKYEFTPAEGAAFDDVVIGELSSVAKELDLSQGAAQKLVDRLGPKIAERTLVAQAEAFKATNEEWVASAKADKEFGGDKLNENLAVAKKALDAFGTPELRELLNTTGIGNHPEFIRAFYRAGLTVSEDKFVSGGTRPSARNTDHATALYGNKH